MISLADNFAHFMSVGIHLFSNLMIYLFWVPSKIIFINNGKFFRKSMNRKALLVVGFLVALIFGAYSFVSMFQVRKSSGRVGAKLVWMQRSTTQLVNYRQTSLYSSTSNILIEKDVVIPMEPPSWDKWEYGTFPVAGINSTVTTIVQEGNMTITKSKMARKLKTSTKVEDSEEWKDFQDKKVFDPLWSYLSDEEVSRAVEALRPFATDHRKEKMNKVLAQRTKNVRFVFENPSNANNIWAALRTLDSFGVQLVDIIFNNETYICEWRKGTMGAALGSQQWMTLREHSNTSDCLSQLKKEGYTIVASDLQASSLQSNRIDWQKLTAATKQSVDNQSGSTSEGGKVAIVMGNENTGITQFSRDLADHLLYIPMKGFAESLNLSVAVAVLCTQLDQQNMLKCGMGEAINNRVLLTWLARTVRGSKKILNRSKIPVPYETMHNRINNITTRP